MVQSDASYTFLFTFRCNGVAYGEPLVEAYVEQLADYDPSVAGDAYRRAWFGTKNSLPVQLKSLGFSDFDVQGVMAALRDHRDADRRLDTTPDRLHAVGFREVPQPSA